MSQKIDMTGVRYGRLTVVANDRPKVLCTCDCGSEVAVSARALVTGNTKSCGCLKRERTIALNHAKRKPSVASGQVFGRLTVIDGTTRPKILCRCDCGTQKQINIQHLLNSLVRSCGCLHRETSQATGRKNARLHVSVGDVFGRLTVVDTAKQGAISCHCECGTETQIAASHLVRGHSKSCGCLKASGSQRTHGLSKHAMYPTWQGMWARCTKPTANGFENYGGRGITVCERWRDPAAFISDIEGALGTRSAGMSLDRIDNDGNYEPGNVRWATSLEQGRNRRPKVSRDHEVTCPSCSHTFAIKESS